MISWMIRPPCEITDQLAVLLAHKTAFRLRFTRLILTLKQAPRMHQNAPLPDKKNHSPLPRPLPYWGGGYPLRPSPDPTPSAPSAPRFSLLRRLAFPFLFIYDSNTVAKLSGITEWYKNGTTLEVNPYAAGFTDQKLYVRQIGLW